MRISRKKKNVEIVLLKSMQRKNYYNTYYANGIG